MAHIETEAIEGRLKAVALVAGPALLAAGWLIQPTPEGSPARALGDIAEALGRWQVSWWLVVAGAGLMIGAALDLGGLVRRTSTTASLIGRALAVIGAVGLVGYAATRGLVASQLADRASDPALAPGVEESWDTIQSGILRPFVYGGEVMAAGIAVIGIGIAQRSAKALVPGLLIIVGALVVFVGLFVAQPVAAGVGAAILLAGTVPLAQTAARRGTALPPS